MTIFGFAEGATAELHYSDGKTVKDGYQGRLIIDFLTNAVVLLP